MRARWGSTGGSRPWLIVAPPGASDPVQRSDRAGGPDLELSAAPFAPYGEDVCSFFWRRKSMILDARSAQYLPVSAVIAVLSLFGAGDARADPVLDWNQVALEATAAAPFDPPRESRTLAMVHAAIFDAVNGIAGECHP